MAFTLRNKEEKPVQYSDSELEIFRLLPKGGRKMSSKVLVAKKYEGAVQPPLNAQKMITSIMTSLIKKVDMNSEEFRISRSKRSGPHPVEFWIEER